MKDWTIIFLGVVSAVIAAIVIEWLNRVFNSNASTANDSAWEQTIGAGQACGLPNLNLRPENPAYSYQTGAPVTNYRAVTRIGVLEVPVQ